MTTIAAPTLFFIVGPLRTGSSLLSRSIDDHEQAICLCEIEINRALFPDYLIRLHSWRMYAHGFKTDPLLDLLDRRRHDDVAAWIDWYRDCVPHAERLYGKASVRAFGDKSPDFYKHVALHDELLRHRLIYTARDPHAILRSVWRQADASDELKRERIGDLIGNIRVWRPHWDRPNLLLSRYEDLVADPQAAMARVHAHLGLPPSTRFMEPFVRQFPIRFLWETAVDMATGVARPYDPGRRRDDAAIPDDQLERLERDPEIRAYRERFGYA